MPDVPQQQPPDVWGALPNDERDYYRMVFVTGDMSLIALCRRYGFFYQTVKKFAQRAGWKTERDTYQAQFADDERKELHNIMADIRRVLLSSFRTICYWYQEQLSLHEEQNTVHEFPLDQWAGKLNVFIDIITKASTMTGVSKEALINNTINNTQVNIGHPTHRANGGNPELDGPPGVMISDAVAKATMNELLTHVMRQTKPREVTVEAQPTNGAR